MIRIEQYPGGPAVEIPDVDPEATDEACAICHGPASASFTLDGDPLCRVCYWQWPYIAHPDMPPPGCELNGTGI